MYRWTLSSDNETRCQCTKILVPRFLTLTGNENGIPCATSTNAADRYWVYDDKVLLLTERTIWNTGYLKTLLDCGSDTDLPTTSASILATTEALVPSTSQFSSLSTTPELECSTPLGMESGEIPDSNIVASSLPSGGHAHEARLNNGKSWVFPRNDTNPWVQVTLLKSNNISRIFVQGSRYGNWFRSLQIQIGSEASSLAYITDDDSNQPVQFQTNMYWPSSPDLGSNFSKGITGEFQGITLMYNTQQNLPCIVHSPKPNTQKIFSLYCTFPQTKYRVCTLYPI